VKRLLLSLTLFLTGCSTLMLPSSPPASRGSLPKSSDETSSRGQTPVAAVQAELDNYGPAPELHNRVWLNTDQPLMLADLRGRVILLDMWTFG
jgi:hypothetical protein